MDLGQRILRLRRSRGLTQRDLAGDRYTAAYVSSVESGRRSPSGDALRYFAEQLGITDEELTSGPPPELDLAFTTALASRDRLPSHDGSASHDGFAEIAAEAGQLGEGKWRAWALLELDAQAHLEEAAALLDGEPALDRIPVVLARAALAEPRYAVYLLEQARDELMQLGFPDPDARHALHAHLAARYLELGDEQRAADAAEEALRLTGPSDGAGYLATARSLIAMRRRADAAVALGQARAAYRRDGLRQVMAACHRARGWRRRDAGDLEAAAADLARARELYGDSDPGLDAAVELAEVRRRLGSTTAATELLALVLTPAPDSTPPATRQHQESEPPRRAGTPPPAVAQAALNAVPLQEVQGPAAADEVPLRVAQGQAALNAVPPREVPGRAGTDEVPLRVGHAYRENALLAIDRGDEAAAERYLRQAIGIYWHDGPRRDLARVLAVLGNLLSGQGRSAEAAELLHDGLLRLENLAS